MYSTEMALFWVPFSVFSLFVGHIWQSLMLTSDSVLRDYSWQGLGDHVG